MATYTWTPTGAPAFASNSANWTPVGVPTTNDDVIIIPGAGICKWDLTAINGILVDTGGEIEFGHVASLTINNLRVVNENSITTTGATTLQFSGIAPHSTAKGGAFILFECADPYGASSDRANLTFEFDIATQTIAFPGGIYPHLDFTTGTGSVLTDYIAPTGDAPTGVSFLSLTTAVNFASQTPTTNDRSHTWTSDGTTAQFDCTADTFDGGYATWTFQGYSASDFTVPTDGAYASTDFTFHKMRIAASVGSGARAKIPGGAILILDSLTVDSGAILLGDDTLGSAIHLIGRPNIKGSWSFHPIADGIYHHKSNYTLGVAHGGTGLQSLAAGRIPFGNDGLTMTSDAALSWDVAASELTVDGKLTVTGLIDPTGMVFTPQAVNPEATNPLDTIWINSEDGHLYRGERNVESTVHFNVRNDEGATIPVGAPLYSKGEIGGSNRIKVGIADASDPNKMPAIGLAMQEMNTSSTQDGNMILTGILNENITITGVAEQDIIYVAPHGGTAPYLTITRPTSSSHLVQNVGVCVRQAAANVSQGMKVAAIGRTNDSPNCSFLTVNTESTHPQARRLVAGTNITLTDGGAGGDLTIAASGGGGGSGTVTSVAATVPTGFTISGSPITTSGTLALAYDTGYSLPTTAKQGQWDTAYGWGDHAGLYEAAGAVATHEATFNHAAFLTAETDPVFTASAASGITSPDIANWNTAYGWGDHAAAGYLTSAPAPDLLLLDPGVAQTGTSSMTAGTKASWNTLNNFVVRTTSGTSPTYDPVTGQITINAAGTYQIILAIVFRATTGGWGLAWSSSYTNYTRLWITRGATTELGPIQMAYSSSMPNTLLRNLDLQVGDIITPVVYWNITGFSSMTCYENSGTTVGFQNHCLVRRID